MFPRITAVWNSSMGNWRAVDISTNGTKVNGERIDEKFPATGGYGPFAKHVFEIQYTPDPEGTPPVEEEDPFALSLLEKAVWRRWTSGIAAIVPARAIAPNHLDRRSPTRTTDPRTESQPHPRT